jgi:SAM-dependent methyltransferase
MRPEPGTQGYAADAQALIARYERIPFAEKHQPVLHLFPSAPADVLDIGAGTGADAAFLAAAGHRVVAVEPTEAFRAAAISLHATQPVEWLDDSLPALGVVRARGQCFDLILLSAVWMHLDQAERAQAMPRVAALLRPGGRVLLSLRHGPVPHGRRMFEVSAEETIQLAQAQGLHCVLNLHTPSVQQINRDAGVMWSRLAFTKAPPEEQPKAPI